MSDHHLEDLRGELDRLMPRTNNREVAIQLIKFKFDLDTETVDNLMRLYADRDQAKQ